MCVFFYFFLKLARATQLKRREGERNFLFRECRGSSPTSLSGINNQAEVTEITFPLSSCMMSASTEVHNMHLHGFMRFAAATRLADWITAWVRCTGVPNKQDSECICVSVPINVETLVITVKQMIIEWIKSGYFTNNGCLWLIEMSAKLHGSLMKKKNPTSAHTWVIIGKQAGGLCGLVGFPAAAHIRDFLPQMACR